jgi:hypothetical protein
LQYVKITKNYCENINKSYILLVMAAFLSAVATDEPEMMPQTNPTLQCLAVNKA